MPNDRIGSKTKKKTRNLWFCSTKEKNMAKKRLLLRPNCRFQKFFFALWLLLWHNRHQFYCQANGHLTPSKVGIASQQADLPPVNHMPLLPHIMPTFFKKKQNHFFSPYFIACGTCTFDLISLCSKNQLKCLICRIFKFSRHFDEKCISFQFRSQYCKMRPFIDFYTLWWCIFDPICTILVTIFWDLNIEKNILMDGRTHFFREVHWSRFLRKVADTLMSP